MNPIYCYLNIKKKDNILIFFNQIMFLHVVRIAFGLVKSISYIESTLTQLIFFLQEKKY